MKTILTGLRNIGKTTWIINHLTDPPAFGGFVTPKNFIGDQFDGYTLVDLMTKESAVFLSLTQVQQRKLGPFYIQEKGVALGKKAVKQALKKGLGLVLDEVGQAELKGGVFAKEVEAVFKQDLACIITVRKDLLTDYYRAYPGLKNFKVTEVIKNDDTWPVD